LQTGFSRNFPESISSQIHFMIPNGAGSSVNEAMFDAEGVAADLREHLQLAQEILALVERENVVLRQSEGAASDLVELKKGLLPRLTDSLQRLKERRAEWTQLPAETRAAHPRIAGLLRQNQDVIMKIIVLDRENEQALLRKGMVPPRHLPSANRNRPHYVADLYRRSGQS
jgi:hypothetical protein